VGLCFISAREIKFTTRLGFYYFFSTGVIFMALNYNSTCFRRSKFTYCVRKVPDVNFLNRKCPCFYSEECKCIYCRSKFTVERFSRPIARLNYKSRYFYSQELCKCKFTKLVALGVCQGPTSVLFGMLRFGRVWDGCQVNSGFNLIGGPPVWRKPRPLKLVPIN
jgi:hypothetical protein